MEASRCRMPLLKYNHSEEQQISIHGTHIPQTEIRDANVQTKRRMSSIRGGHASPDGSRLTDKAHCVRTFVWQVSVVSQHCLIACGFFAPASREVRCIRDAEAEVRLPTLSDRSPYREGVPYLPFQRCLLSSS